VLETPHISLKIIEEPGLMLAITEIAINLPKYLLRKITSKLLRSWFFLQYCNYQIINITGKHVIAVHCYHISLLHRGTLKI
jgi:hypothetical protein